MKQSSSTPLVVAGLMLASLVSGRAQQPAPQPAVSGSPPVFDGAGGQKMRVVTVATGLFHPWSIAFLPDASMLVVERNGKLRVIRNGALDPRPVWTAPPGPADSTDTLHAVAVHPQFAQNHYVYLSH